MKCDAKCKTKIEWFGVVSDHSRLLEIAPFDRAHMSYDFLLAFHSNYVPVLHGL